MSRFSFPKKEKLTGEIRIGNLFMKGKGFVAYPLRVVYLKDEKNEDTPIRVVINVPKRRIKKAVKRNLLKRRIREAYRLHKEDFTQSMAEKDFSLHIGINYVADEPLEFSQIEKKMIEAFDKLRKKILEL